MTYQVIVREMEGGKNRDGTPFMVKRYCVSWGKEPREDEPYLSVWADGSMSAVWNARGMEERIFLYDDQWRGMIAALEQAMSDKKADRERQAAQWLAANCDKRKHYSYAVDLSINEAKAALTIAPLRWNQGMAEVCHDGKWLHLCRTDLSDDVCTSGGEDGLDLETLRRKYLRGIRFGARLNHEKRPGYSRFAVVDAFSDG